MTELTHAERAEIKAAVARAAYIKGLVELAYLLDANPDIPLPYDGQPDLLGPDTVRGIHIVSGATSSATAERLAELLGRPARVEIRDGLWMAWRISGIAVITSAPMSVCEPVVAKVIKVGDRLTEVTEYVVPDRFQPAPAEDPVQA